MKTVKIKAETKKTEKSILTKNHIYHTAISLFQKIGYEKATMRVIASNADVALGATYYHFRTKEDIVFHFYFLSQEEAKLQSQSFNEHENDFSLRINNIIQFKLNYFAKYRKFISVLAHNAGDANHPLSPFSQETKVIREEAIQIFKDAIDSSNLKGKGTILEILPELLWLYQICIIYFWISDKSKNFEKTKKLISESMDLILKLIKISNLPFFQMILNPIIKIYHLIKEN
ncbi:MAG: TetR family transcriptional regulator [Leptospira sp.]|nr:TetR family transcriptional regulator [Leptospira sp.]